MQQHSPVESQLSTLYQKTGEIMTSESEVLGKIIAELSATQGFVSNKAIILKLLERIEAEEDVVQLDIYRMALEDVVQRTPDDLIV